MLNAAMMRLRLKRQLRNRKLNILAVRETVSTNSDLHRAAMDGQREMTLLVALRQSGGRGQGEKTFFSPKGGLYFSLLFPVDSLKRPEDLTVTTAIAVTDALQTLGFDPKIKWVNDVYLGDKKAAGILVQSGCGKNGAFAIIGIGMNLITPKGGFPKEISSIATALDSHTRRKISPSLLCSLITERLISLLEELPKSKESLLVKYRALSCLDGKKVTVKNGNDEYTATVIGINDDFTLSVTTDDGETISLHSGNVSLVPHRQ